MKRGLLRGLNGIGEAHLVSQNRGPDEEGIVTSNDSRYDRLK